MSLSRDPLDCIDDAALAALLQRPSDQAQLADVLAKSLAKEPLSAAETAVLLRADQPDQIEQVTAAAHQLKRDVYGSRIVLFAPLYVGNSCINDCVYCGFRRSNAGCVRLTLSPDELTQQVSELERVGHKRLILVFGEHPTYDAAFIAETARRVYEVQVGHGAIRRVNINAAPLDLAGYRTVKDAGIGTYQVFQETYHHATYTAMHPRGTRKADYLWRLHALSRAQEAGIDDVGLGVLFGLYDWRFETLAMVTHANWLRSQYGVGPHTLSFPRLQPASGVRGDWPHQVSDAEFLRLVAILRLAVPYTGLICTCRESPAVRRAVMAMGVSQIDAGTRLEIGGYRDGRAGADQELDREQFRLGDTRSLDEVVRELLEDGNIPSFCTACYRLGRTGEVFMEYAVPGFIERFCTPNALSTLCEYLTDYASPETRALGEQCLAEQLVQLPIEQRQALAARLRAIRETDQRDLFC